MRVGHDVRERVRPVVVLVRDVRERPADVRHMAVGAVRMRFDRQRVAVGVGVVLQHVDVHGRVLGHRRRIVVRRRGVVLARDRHRHRRGIRAAVTVVGRIREPVLHRFAHGEALELAVRVVGEPAVLVHRHRRAHRAGRVIGRDGQRVAVIIGVVAQHAGCADGQRRVLVRAVRVVVGLRGIVHRAHADEHRGGVLAALAVVHRVGEAVGAVVAALRRVGQLAGGRFGHRAVSRLRERADAQRIVFRIGVVGQHVDHHRRVLVSFGRVVVRHRIVVDAGDRHRHRRRVAAAIAVTDGVLEAVEAVVVRARRVRQHPVAAVGHTAVNGVRERLDAQRIGRIGVVRQDVDPNGRVLGRRGRVVVGRRRDVRHVDPHRIRPDAHVVVGDRQCDFVGAVIIGREAEARRDAGAAVRVAVLLDRPSIGKRIQRGGVADTAAQVDGRALRAAARGACDGRRRRHIAHRYVRGGRGRARVVVRHRHADRVAVRRRAARVVVQILMRLAEGRRPHRVAERRNRRTVAPVHPQRERVQRARVADRTAQR